MPGLVASAMTFGYEYIGDTAKVRVNENFAGFPFGQGATASMTTNAVYAGLQTTVLRASGADRAGCGTTGSTDNSATTGGWAASTT